jgi:hypothetical protein
LNPSHKNIANSCSKTHFITMHLFLIYLVASCYLQDEQLICILLLA